MDTGFIIFGAFAMAMMAIAAISRWKLDRYEIQHAEERADHQMLKDVIALPGIWENLNEPTRAFLQTVFGIRQDAPLVFSSSKLTPEEKNELREFARSLQGARSVKEIFVLGRDFVSKERRP